MNKLIRILALTLLPTFAIAQDVEFQRAWESAQKQRPAVVASVATIAPPSEPGSPFTIRGKVVGLDGKSALADAIVFAWQTDAKGLYDKKGSKPHSWRLHGWVKSDRTGNFTFHTIRPGMYPDGGAAPHVHFSIVTKEGKRYFPNELQLSEKPSPSAMKGGREIAEVVLKIDANRTF